MSSLQGAPSLGGGGKRQFTYDVDWNDQKGDDDYIPEVTTAQPKSSKRPDSKKDKRKSEKHKKPSSTEHQSHGREKPKTKDKREPKTPQAKPVEQAYEDDFEDDFEEEGDEQVIDSDDYIPPVVSTPPPPPLRESSPAGTKPREREASSSKGGDDDDSAVAELAEKLRAERVQHEKKVREWEEALSRKEQEAQARQAALQSEIASLKAQQTTAADVERQVNRMLADKLAAMQQQPPQQQQQQRATAGTEKQEDPSDDNVADGDGGNAAEEDDRQQQQQQRRRQRERERALQLRRLHEEEAARSLFQRLAQDVRDVFHELNLSVVAAEKERLMKDERYRKEREARDRKEEMERAEKLQKEMKERVEREERFWSAVEEREEKLRLYTEERLRKDEEERESRLKRDLEDRATRAQNERSMRDELERLEKERRAKQEADLRQRDTLVLEGQLDEVKAQYARQIEEVRRQNDLAREHSEELHRVELQMMERRHEAALEQLLLQHSQQVVAMEKHSANAAKLEQLIAGMHDEMESTKKMNEKLTAERLSVLQARENQLDEQKAVLNAVMADLREYKGDLEKERARVVGLYTKFELSLSSFVKNAEEDRRRLQEAQAHYDTLRQQAERDRKLMLSEIAQERKVLEQQQEELLAKKMETLGEIQGERATLSRERTEAAVARERQNRDESELLRSLRDREQEYAMRIESLENDRVCVTTMKAEQRELLERAAAECESLRREREAFEREKSDLLGRFEEIRRRAEDAASSQDRLRKSLVEERAAREFGIGYGATPGGAIAAHSDPADAPLPASVASRLQMDLARQRAVLQKISS